VLLKGVPTLIEWGEAQVIVGVALFTVWVTADDVDAAKFVSPLYTAVMEWEPTNKADVLNVATPPDNVPVPMEVPPSLNVTVPVGVPTELVIVAVKATGTPKVDGLGDDVTPVDVDAWLTVNVPEAELAPKMPCAAYTAFKI
jgi:hypothetical protein